MYSKRVPQIHSEPTIQPLSWSPVGLLVFPSILRAALPLSSSQTTDEENQTEKIVGEAGRRGEREHKAADRAERTVERRGRRPGDERESTNRRSGKGRMKISRNRAKGSGQRNNSRNAEGDGEKETRGKQRGTKGRGECREKFANKKNRRLSPRRGKKPPFQDGANTAPHAHRCGRRAQRGAATPDRVSSVSPRDRD